MVRDVLVPLAYGSALGAVPRRQRPPIRGLIPRHKPMEHQMYIGGGLLGTLLLVLLIVYLVRRV
jgi:hypothetical protein